MNDSIDTRLVDEAVDAYVDWREECLVVWDAYGRWTGAPPVDARLAFVAYTAALEIEEQACAVYSSVIRRIGDLVTKDPRRASSPCPRPAFSPLPGVGDS